MYPLRVHLWVSETVRKVPCAFCDRPYVQHYVSVLLFEGDRLLGDLCPECLAGGPAHAAHQVRRRAALGLDQVDQIRREVAAGRERAGQSRGEVVEALRRAEEAV